MLLLLLLLLSLATSSADELTEGKCADGVDVVARGGRGELLERIAGRVGIGSGSVGGRVDDGTEHLPETRVETDALSADELAQGTGQFDARELS